MELKPLPKKKRRSVVKLLKLIFPAISVAVLWKIFYKEKESKIGITEGLQHGELFWQSFFTRFQKQDEHTSFSEISYEGKFCGVLADSTIYFLFQKLLFLKFFAIKKSFQGQGIGTLVVENLEEISRENGYDYIFLLSSPFKKNIQKFYFKVGYKRIFWGLFWKKL
jgi:ribosomal protein S18 acetylase RimI-like enzyme